MTLRSLRETITLVLTSVTERQAIAFGLLTVPVTYAAIWLSTGVL